MTGIEWCYIVGMFAILFIGLVIMNIVIALELANFITDKIIWKLEEMEEKQDVREFPL